MSKAKQRLLLKKIFKNTGIVLFGNLTASAINLISFTIMANQLGPSALAYLVLAQTYTLIVNDVLNVQTWESMMKFGSRDLKDCNIASVIKTNFIIDVISAGVAFLFALMLVGPVVDLLEWDSALISIISLYSISILFNITSLTIGIPRLFDKFSEIAKIQALTAVLKLLCILFAMSFSESLLFYIQIYLAADIFANVLLILLSFTLLRRRLGKSWWKSELTIDRNQLVFIWWTNLRTVIRIPVRHIDMIIVSMVMTMQMVGIYKVYKEIAGILNRISEPINQTIYPEFTELIRKKNSGGAIDIAKKTMKVYCGISFLVTFSILVASKYVIQAFFGPEYLEDLDALYYLLVAYGVGIVLTPINSLFIAAGFAKYSVYLVMFTNAMYLVAVFFLGISWGIYGVITAWLIQAFLNQGLKVLLLKRYNTGWDSIVR